ncbi:MAG TPA: ferritin [Candidatus Hydrogenedens sp.]|nr:ferritin [Candidatus Hydrogenedens sp.]HPP57915.1 ferritin [Candidatus Hydrogenedens sp.]
MIKEKMLKALNKQINEELYSAYLYASMRAYFESLNLKGFANWLKIQVQEELFHARKFENYIYERGGKVELYEIKEPDRSWKNPADAFEAVYKHECHITECIHHLAEIAEKEGDRSTRLFLDWFINEQVEEEANADDILQRIRMVGDAPGGIYWIDKELGQRVVNPLIIADITGAPQA